MKQIRILWNLIIFVALAGLTSCGRNEGPHFGYCTNADHTLLIYMVGDDYTMNMNLQSNLDSIMLGIRSCSQPINLVIYRDNRTSQNSLPQLYQLKLRDDRSAVDTIFLKKWKTDIDSSNPQTIADVVKMTFGHFKSSIKGFDYWGHGFSWIPSDKFVPDSTGTRAMEYVGIDDGNKGEIWDLSDALEETGVHLDYIIFDACNMASAEVAYQMRNICDYILAAPTEIMAEGLPYRTTIQSLSEIKEKEDIVPGLTNALNDFAAQYNARDMVHTGTMSLLYTAGFDRLLSACQHLESQTREALAAWEQNPAKYESKIQHYGRSEARSQYFFYDVQDWADQLCNQTQGISSDEVADALQDCVLLHYNTRVFYGSIPLNRCSGLSMSIPQFWSLSNNSNLDAAYKLLDWNL